jgi:genome maintenance exonuclease 1
LYAGTTDVVGIYKGKPAIVDFKQTNRPKQESWVTDYKLQLAAYAMAHNILFDTKISTAVILMCSRDRYFQKFELNEKDYWYICCKWMTRVAEFYGD